MFRLARRNVYKDPIQRSFCHFLSQRASSLSPRIYRDPHLSRAALGITENAGGGTTKSHSDNSGFSAVEQPTRDFQTISFAAEEGDQESNQNESQLRRIRRKRARRKRQRRKKKKNRGAGEIVSSEEKTTVDPESTSSTTTTKTTIKCNCHEKQQQSNNSCSEKSVIKRKKVVSNDNLLCCADVPGQLPFPLFG